jgi:hypothetical protein
MGDGRRLPEQRTAAFAAEAASSCWRGAIPAQGAPADDPQVRWRASSGGANVGVHALAEHAVANHHVPERPAHLEPHRTAKAAPGRARPGVIVIGHLEGASASV